MESIASRSLKYLGLATAVCLAYKAITLVQPYVTPSKLARYQHGKPGSTWALITGGSDGIGYAFAVALLDRGFNVLLHGRNEAKLSGIRDDLQKKHPNLQIRYVLADASVCDNASIDDIVSACRSLPGKLSVLINNIGGAPSPHFRELASSDAAYVDTVMNLNARFPAQVTRALLSTLEQNGPALVMNIGSAVGHIGMPYLATYSGSKAFNATFSKSLRREVAMRGKDVEVLGILVATVISGGNSSTVQGFTATSQQIAEYSLNRVGCGKALVWAWWRHDLQSTFMDLFMPEWATDSILSNIIGRLVREQSLEEEGKKQR